MKQRYSREKFGLAIVMFMLVLMPSVHAEAIIIDHTCTDISQIPADWINQSKAMFNLSYGHTSHGSQIVTGMNVIKNPAGSLYWWDHDGTQDGLSLHDRTPSGDLGNPDRYTWESRTRAMLDNPGNDRNMVMWSWCGQVNGNEAEIQQYLDLMTELEADYPDVVFIYMTGHLNACGAEGNVNQRNNQIRTHCSIGDRVLFDFADIESYDPDGDTNFMELYANDNCNYNGGNWADEWCDAHNDSALCTDCGCAHSKPLNCNLKAKAFWWMMARLAGWDGLPEDDVIYVPGDCTSIQAAVNAAIAGDTIIVQDGTYYENVNVDKRLTIRSENGAASCIVNASDPYDHVFEISEDLVNITGFTVQNATGYSMTSWKHAGIHITSSKHVNISDCVAENNVFGIRADSSYYSELMRNIVRDNMYGIYLASSPYATLTENALSNNSVRNLDTSGTNTASYWHKHTIDTTNTVNGKPIYYYTDSNDLILENRDAGHISLIDCTNATVRGCSVIGCDELRLISTLDSHIEGNTVCDTGYAIRLLYSDNNIVLDNTANDNGNGIRVQHGNDNWVENNTLKRNQYGVYVEGCDNTTVIDNMIEDSTYHGCWLYNNNHILNNTIQRSKYYGLYINGYSNLVSGNTIIDSEDTPWSGGISLSGYSSGNLIYNNYLDNLNNTRDDGSNNIWNTSNTTGPNIIGGPFIGGNYWSDYTGNDGNGDGFGETAYNITDGTNKDYLPLVHVQGICGDVDGNGLLNIMDVRLLLNHVNNPTGYPVDSWAGDVSGGGIGIADVQLLLTHVFDPVGHALMCG